MKPGIKTTEFWVTLLVVAAGLLEAVNGWLPAGAGVVAAAVAAGLYAASRALVKRSASDETVRRELFNVLGNLAGPGDGAAGLRERSPAGGTDRPPET